MLGNFSDALRVSLVPPPGGFFAAAVGAELRSSGGMEEPSYRTTTGGALGQSGFASLKLLETLLQFLRSP